MKQIKWDENKIKELNSWIEDDSTSSIGAVLLELQEVIKVLQSNGALKIFMNGAFETIVNVPVHNPRESDSNRYEYP